MTSYTYTLGASYRRDFMIRLDELDLPYTEHRTMFESIVIVRTRTVAQEDAYYQFELEFADFQRRFEDDKRRAENRRQDVKRQEKEKKLARKNRFRRLTLRKPLQSL